MTCCKEKEKNEKLPDSVDDLKALAKAVVNKAFEYVSIVATIILAILNVNEIEVEAAFKKAAGEEALAIYKGNTTTVDTMTSAAIDAVGSVYKINENNKVPFIVACCCAGYGVLLGVWVYFRAFNNKSKAFDFDGSNIRKAYLWSNMVPILDSLFEIPIAFVFEPVQTVLLWCFFLVVAVCLLSTVFLDTGINTEAMKGAANTIATQDSSLSTLITELSTNIVAGYQLYRLTGEVSEYFVLESAQAKARTQVLEDTYNKVHNVEA